jgi:ABC-2 type transport system permease protein
MRVELLRLLLDRASIGLIVMVPAVQLILFGYTVNFTPKDVPIAIGRACEAHFEVLEAAVSNAGSFRLVRENPGLQASQYVSSGRARVAIDCRSGNGLSLIADGSNPLEVQASIGALEAALLANLLNAASALALPVPAVEWLYNPDARTAWFIAPGLVGVILMISMLMLGALTLVREREQGSWEGLLSTPITALDALVGKLTPYVIIAIAQMLVVVALARWLFDLPIKGDVVVLVVSGAVFAIAHLSLGFVLSAIAASQTQAIQAAVFFYLPSMLLSGFLFPYESMPRWAQYVGNTLPLTHFVRSARGVLLKGFGAREVGAEMWPVAVFALAAGILAMTVFRRQLR